MRWDRSRERVKQSSRSINLVLLENIPLRDRLFVFMFNNLYYILNDGKIPHDETLLVVLSKKTVLVCFVPDLSIYIHGFSSYHEMILYHRNGRMLL